MDDDLLTEENNACMHAWKQVLIHESAPLLLNVRAHEHPLLTVTNECNYLVSNPTSQQLTYHSPLASDWVIMFYFC